MLKKPLLLKAWSLRNLSLEGVESVALEKSYPLVRIDLPLPVPSSTQAKHQSHVLHLEMMSETLLITEYFFQSV